jgi:hypothetical protein
MDDGPWAQDSKQAGLRDFACAEDRVRRESGSVGKRGSLLIFIDARLPSPLADVFHLTYGTRKLCLLHNQALSDGQILHVLQHQGEGDPSHTVVLRCNGMCVRLLSRIQGVELKGNHPKLAQQRSLHQVVCTSNRNAMPQSSTAWRFTLNRDPRKLPAHLMTCPRGDDEEETCGSHNDPDTHSSRWPDLSPTSWTLPGILDHSSTSSFDANSIKRVVTFDKASSCKSLDSRTSNHCPVHSLIFLHLGYSHWSRIVNLRTGKRLSSFVRQSFFVHLLKALCRSHP